MEKVLVKIRVLFPCAQAIHISMTWKMFLNLD